MRNSHQRFLRTWLTGSLLALSALALFNLSVDPRGVFLGLNLEALEAMRYSETSRPAKGEIARHGGWEVIILGSSRVQTAFPADHPVLQGRTGNLGLNAARIAELSMALDYARTRSDVRQVILGLDYYMFSAGPDMILDFPECRLHPRVDLFAYYSRHLLGASITEDSFHLLRDRLANRIPPVQDRFGFNDKRMKDTESQRAVFERNMANLGPGYAKIQYQPTNMEWLRHIIRDCREHGIELRICIMPMHVANMELIHAGNQWPDFEQWKRDLVRVLREEGVESEAPLIDFSDYRGYSTEEIPPIHDTRTRMKYWLENSHATTALGSIMMDTLYGPGPSTFGVKLDGSNLEAHLAEMRNAREEYVLTHPEECKWAQGIGKGVGP